MEPVYMGLFAKLFKKVYEAVIQPVMNFLIGLFKSIFSWVFENLLKPLLLNVIFPVLKSVASMIMDVFSVFLFDLYTMILKMIEYVIHIFYVFSGIENVTYDGAECTLMEALFYSPTIQKAAWIVMAIGFVLILMFTILEVSRSVLDLGNEVSRPVVKVLHSTFNSFIKMIMIPFVCLFLVTLSGTVLKSISTGIEAVAINDENVGTKTSIPRIIFSITTLDAALNPRYNISARGDRAEDIGMTDAVRAPFYYSDYKGEGGSKNYLSYDVVCKTFEYKDIDYALGLILSLLMLYILVSCAFKFIARIVNVIILYVVSPLFAATIPRDEGKMYESWKDRFVGELFVGYGTVISMQIYLLIIPYIMDEKLTFGEGTIEANALIRVFFLVGGAYTVLKAGPIITGFISQSAATGENQNQAVGGMVAMQAGGGALSAAKTAGRLGGRLGGKALGTLKGNPYKKLDKKGNEVHDGNLKQHSFLGGRFTMTYDKDGKGHFGMNMGKHFRFGMQKDGTYKRNIFGFSKKWDEKGNLKSKSVPFVKWKADSEGNMHVSKIALSEGLQMKRAEKITKDENGNQHVTYGDMYVSNFSPLGIERSHDTKTGEVHLDSVNIGGMSIYERVVEPDDSNDTKDGQ